MGITFNTKPSDNVNWLRERPVAHRGLHTPEDRIYENTLSAAAAAVRRDYSIEVDLQPSVDGVAMIFHDYTLDRMTNEMGEFRDLKADRLQTIQVKQSNDRIPTLAALLDLVAGEVGLVLELKGRPDADDGFVAAVARDLENYSGDVAIMSFHHHILEDARRIAPHLTLGLTAYGDDSKYDQHKSISEKTQVDFVSYELANLNTRFVQEYKKSGRPLISWTVKSEADAQISALHADQPTFEGFLP